MRLIHLHVHPPTWKKSSPLSPWRAFLSSSASCWSSCCQDAPGLRLEVCLHWSTWSSRESSSQTSLSLWFTPPKTMLSCPAVRNFWILDLLLNLSIRSLASSRAAWKRLSAVVIWEGRFLSPWSWSICRGCSRPWTRSPRRRHCFRQYFISPHWL